MSSLRKALVLTSVAPVVGQLSVLTMDYSQEYSDNECKTAVDATEGGKAAKKLDEDMYNNAAAGKLKFDDTCTKKEKGAFEASGIVSGELIEYVSAGGVVEDVRAAHGLWMNVLLDTNVTHYKVKCDSSGLEMKAYKDAECTEANQVGKTWKSTTVKEGACGTANWDTANVSAPKSFYKIKCSAGRATFGAVAVVAAWLLM